MLSYASGINNLYSISCQDEAGSIVTTQASSEPAIRIDVHPAVLACRSMAMQGPDSHTSGGGCYRAVE